MKKLLVLVIVLGGIVVCASPVPASPLYDIKVTAAASATTLGEGASGTITCKWQAVLTDQLGGSGYTDGTGTITHMYNNIKNVIKKVSLPAPGGSAAPFSATWVAQGTGLHTFECAVIYTDNTQLYNAKEPTYANNKQSVGIKVVAMETGQPWAQPAGTFGQSCAKSVDVWIEVDPASLSAGKVSSVAGKRKGTLPLISSQAFLRQSVQCGYGCGKLSTSYMFPCKDAQKADAPHKYWCKQ